jgi:hypothetical protein
LPTVILLHGELKRALKLIEAVGSMSDGDAVESPVGALTLSLVKLPPAIGASKLKGHGIIGANVARSDRDAKFPSDLRRDLSMRVIMCQKLDDAAFGGVRQSLHR